MASEMLPTQNIEIEQKDTLVVVTVRTSQLAVTEVQELVDELRRRLRYHNAHQFLLDMEGVEFMSSACLGSLVDLLCDLEHIRGRIVLANCHSNVAFIFKVTRLHELFSIYENVEEALLALKHV